MHEKYYERIGRTSLSEWADSIRANNNASTIDEAFVNAATLKIFWLRKGYNCILWLYYISELGGEYS